MYCVIRTSAPSLYNTKILLVKRHILECTELIYVKTMETACVSNELCRLKEKEEDGEFRRFT